MRNHSFFRVFLVVALVLACGSPVLSSAAESPAGSEELADTTKAPQFVAYYFHGNFRCATCRKLEAYSEEAISSGFADELASGELIWKILNTDEEDHKHFVNDFELVTKSVVLVEYRDGRVVRFENLKDVWKLVGNEDDFVKYVQDSTREFLGQG